MTPDVVYAVKRQLPGRPAEWYCGDGLGWSEDWWRRELQAKPVSPLLGCETCVPIHRTVKLRSAASLATQHGFQKHGRKQVIG